MKQIQATVFSKSDLFMTDMQAKRQGVSAKKIPKKIPKKRLTNTI